MHTLHTWFEPAFFKTTVDKTNKLNYLVYRLAPKEEK